MARRTIKINGYPIDLARSEEIRYPSKVTPHAVESGSDFTDNIHNDGVEVTLECLVSDTPIGAIATDPTRQVIADNQQTPSEDARERLLAIRAARQPFTIETSKGVFENMALEDLSETSNATTTGGLTFTAKFKQIIIRSNRRTTVRIASRLPGGVVDFGLVLDRFRDGQLILWRHGFPAGATFIFKSEFIFSRKGQLVHENNNPLDKGELKAFKADLARDSQGIETHSEMLKRQAAQKSATASETLKRAQQYQNAQAANPGKKVDPALFGLSGKPTAFDSSTVPKDSPLRGPDGPLATGPL